MGFQMWERGFSSWELIFVFENVFQWARAGFSGWGAFYPVAVGSNKWE